MPISCCIKGCHSKWGRDQVKFHRFPRNPDLKKMWVKILKLKFIPTYHRVCSSHFPKDSLSPSGRLKRNCLPLVPTMGKVKTLVNDIPAEHNYYSKRCLKQEVSENSVEESPQIKLEPKTFGDSNSDQLNTLKDEKKNLKVKKQFINIGVKTQEVLKLKKKLKTCQQTIRRRNKRIAVLEDALIYTFFLNY